MYMETYLLQYHIGYTTLLHAQPVNLGTYTYLLMSAADLSMSSRDKIKYLPMNSASSLLIKILEGDLTQKKDIRYYILGTDGR